MKTTCVMVLGNHRSGTSAVAGVLHRLGVEMAYGGERFMLPPAHGNPAGHYEDKRIVNLNDSFLSGRLNTNAMQSRATAEMFKRAKFRHPRFLLWGMKDPRFCMTARIYETALKDIGDTVLKIIETRRPISEIVRSLMQRDCWTEERARKFATDHDKAKTRYLESVTEVTLDNIMTVDYHDLIDEPRQIITKIRRFLDIPLIPSQARSAEEFIDPDLCHWRIDPE